jgi:hypothetical protein
VHDIPRPSVIQLDHITFSAREVPNANLKIRVFVDMYIIARGGDTAGVVLAALGLVDFTPAALDPAYAGKEWGAREREGPR